MPLDDYIAAAPPEGWPDDFYQSQVDAFQYNGMQYAIPYDWASGGFYVNLDVLDRAGVEVPTADWTFDQLLEAGVEDQGDAPNPDEAVGRPTCRPQSQDTDWIVRSFGGNQVTADPLTSHFDDPEHDRGLPVPVRRDLDPRGDAADPDSLQAMGLANSVAFASGLVGIMYSLNDEAFVFSEVVGDEAEWTMAPTPTGTGGALPVRRRLGLLDPDNGGVPRHRVRGPEVHGHRSGELPRSPPRWARCSSRAWTFWEDALPDPEQADPEVYKEVFYTLGIARRRRPALLPRLSAVGLDHLQEEHGSALGECHRATSRRSCSRSMKRRRRFWTESRRNGVAVAGRVGRPASGINHGYDGRDDRHRVATA